MNIKQILAELKIEMKSDEILVQDFNIPLPLMEKLSRQKKNKQKTCEQCSTPNKAYSQKLQNSNSFLAHIEHFPKYTIY
jgi:hypothetical protein